MEVEKIMQALEHTFPFEFSIASFIVFISLGVVLIQSLSSW